ncbi:MAG: single-stranded DNA-binding protein [Clostridia bacterium]
MNKVILIGRLTADPELSNTPSGIAVCRFTLAVNRTFKTADGQTADFINIIAWRTQAENTCKYLKKGDPCAIVGAIQTRTYEKDGQKRYSTEVVADSVEFLPRNNNNGSSGGSYEKKSIEDLEPIDTDDSSLPF